MENKNPLDQIKTTVFSYIKNESKLNLALIAIIIVSSSYSIYMYSDKNKVNKINSKFEKSNISSTFKKVIYADIDGAVANPGVYELDDGSRVNDLIIKAGGFSKECNYEFISKNLNKSEKVKDGIKLYIPFKNETTTITDYGLSDEKSDSNTISENKASTLININTASDKELDELPGIGEVNVENIITNRPYSSIEELVEKKVLTQSRFDNIKELIEI